MKSQRGSSLTMLDRLEARTSTHRSVKLDFSQPCSTPGSPRRRSCFRSLKMRLRRRGSACTSPSPQNKRNVDLCSPATRLELRRTTAATPAAVRSRGEGLAVLPLHFCSPTNRLHVELMEILKDQGQDNDSAPSGKRAAEALAALTRLGEGVPSLTPYVKSIVLRLRAAVYCPPGGFWRLLGFSRGTASGIRGFELTPSVEVKGLNSLDAEEVPFFSLLRKVMQTFETELRFAEETRARLSERIQRTPEAQMRTSRAREDWRGQ